MTDILAIGAYHPAEEWRNLFHLKPSHKREIIFGFLLRLLVGIVSVVVFTIVLMVVGFFNDWQLTTPLIAMFGGFVCLSVYFGEHVRSRVFERSIAPRSRNAEAVANIEKKLEGTRQAFPSDRWRVLLKRLIDVIAASIAVPLLLPVLMVITLVIKVTSLGPILFRTQRLGLHRRMFHAYEFRTMVVAENHAALQVDAFARTRDPRVTASGYFLRKSSLDKLPLLFNVLIGDMSLVGPSLLPLDMDERVTNLLAETGVDRHSMRPGMTSLAGVSALISSGPSNREFSRLVASESHYLANWSFSLDLKISVLALSSILKRANAY